MKPMQRTEALAYGLVIILLLAVLLALAIAPPDFLDVTAVYKGF